ncbi:hypothetical protein AB0F72_13610 [Actinoplanes sp. NPDC023936]|uniref:hypothetical protein n=1 Tax=Actinoplanes sp. NPDC023936 TaxID=3154910 RepID=UPI0033FB0EB7
MMVRATRIRSSSLADLFTMVAETGSRTLVVDVEPLILHWSEPDSRFRSRAAAFVELVGAESPSIHRIVFASNSRRVLPRVADGHTGRVTVVSQAGKPWRLDLVAGLPRPVTVIGDQPGTDGVLAWRLGGGFHQWVHRGTQPWWPRTQMRLGSAFAPIIFRPHRPGGSAER